MRKIKEKRIRDSQINLREVQTTYMKGQIQETPNADNKDLLNKFIKDFPKAQYQLSTKDIGLIRQNIKKRTYELTMITEKIDEILDNRGKRFLREKVFILPFE